jgi:hypothetical protein
MAKNIGVLTRDEKRRMHSLVRTLRGRLASFDRAISNDVDPEAMRFELGLLPYLRELKDIHSAARARAVTVRASHKLPLAPPARGESIP